MKKKLSILLLASLLLGLTAGCGGEPKAETPMGRYVEKPGQALEGLDWVDSLRRTETGDLVFYGRDISSGKAVYYRCVMPAEGESVEKMEVSWLNEFLEVEGKDRLLIQISEGADGTVYVLYNEIDHEAMEGSYAYHGPLLARSTNGGVPETLSVAELEENSKDDSPDLFAHIGMDDKGIYLADSTGIYRQTLGGGILERLVDANMTSLIMPNQNMECNVSDGEDAIWAIL